MQIFHYYLKPENFLSKRAGSNFQYFTEKRGILKNEGHIGKYAPRLAGNTGKYAPLI